MNKICQTFLELNSLLELLNKLKFKFHFDNPHIRKNFGDKLIEEICHKINYLVDEECLQGLQEKICTCRTKSPGQEYLEKINER